jgi:hypothetical protein
LAEQIAQMAKSNLLMMPTPFRCGIDDGDMVRVLEDIRARAAA